MKYFSLFSICLLIMSCGPSVLEITDVDTHVTGKNGVLKNVKQGDTWEDVKKLAGDYWTISEDQAPDYYQFRKDIDLANEHMFISFKMNEGKVAGMGTYILSANIPYVAFKIFQTDIWQLYRNKFGIDLSNPEENSFEYNGKSYSHTVIFPDENEEGSKTLMIDCYQF